MLSFEEEKPNNTAKTKTNKQKLNQPNQKPNPLST